MRWQALCGRGKAKLHNNPCHPERERRILYAIQVGYPRILEDAHFVQNNLLYLPYEKQFNEGDSFYRIWSGLFHSKHIPARYDSGEMEQLFIWFFIPAGHFWYYRPGAAF